MRPADNTEIVVTAASRTAVGSFGKSLKNISAEDLGSTVISRLIKNSNIKKNEIDEIILGQVLTAGSGQNTARQAAIKSGGSKEVPAYVVNQVCGSGKCHGSSGGRCCQDGSRDEERRK